MANNTLIDLFAGAGGLAYGLKMAGFSPLLANELEPTYAKTYQHNHPETEVVVGDIGKISASHIRTRLGVKKGEIDLLAWGPALSRFFNQCTD